MPRFQGRGFSLPGKYGLVGRELQRVPFRRRAVRCRRGTHSLEMRWQILVLGATMLAVAPSRTDAQTLPPGYVGSETCAGCHADLAKAFAISPHHPVDVDAKRGWQGRACESCHGPGQKHAESANPALISNPANLAAAAADKICLTCHLNQPTQIGRLESSH